MARSATVCAFLAALAVVLSSPRLPAQAPPDEFLISEGKAGRLEVGMTVDAALQAFGRERVRLVDLNHEGFFTPAIEIDVPGSAVRAAIVGEITEGPCGGFSVRSLTIRDPRFRTLDGLGVGSTLVELQKRRAVRISREEGWSAMVPNSQIAFGLGASAGTADARVTLVRVWLDAKTVRERRCPTR